MSRSPLAIAAALCLVATGCMQSAPAPAPVASQGGAQAAPAALRGVLARRDASARAQGPGAATLPDHGALLAIDTPQRPRAGASGPRWPVRASEAHAFAAAAPGGAIALPLPGGGVLPLRYAHHVEHGDGNWTWVGRTDDGGDAVLTFGPTATFGDVRVSPSRRLVLSTRAGGLWLADVDTTRENDANASPTALATDAMPAPDGSAVAAMLGDALERRAEAPLSMATVDVLLGYSSGLAADLGGSAAAETRMQHLVAVTNTAYANSQVTAQVRLVGTRQVAYADASNNQDALQDLTGYTCTPSCTPRTVPASLQPLRDQRESTGADLVALVRDLRTPEQAGCGVAWLLGDGGSPITTSLAPFGYAVVSDGEDRDEGDGLVYTCRVESLAHEFGHNMGQTHNTEDSSGIGAHPYSYGYREASSSGFYTVMAYRQPSSQQFPIMHFANPQVAYAGRPTGTATADNVRSMQQTIPVVAQFRGAVAPPVQRPDVFAFDRVSSTTRIATLSGVNDYQVLSPWRASALHPTGRGDEWVFRTADRDRDGSIDVYAIKRVGGNGRLEVHVLNGGSGFDRFQLQVATPLTVGSSGQWAFDVADFNGDGVPDLYCIDRMGGSGTTQVHVLDGASNFQVFSLHTATALHPTGTDPAWKFTVGDRNGDGRPDLYVIKRDGGTGRTELHVLDGASTFSRFSLHAATALHSTGSGHDWDFAVADYNADGIRDLYVFKKSAPASTEVHVLDGATAYTTWVAHRTTPLPPSGTDQARVFDIP